MKYLLSIQFAILNLAPNFDFNNFKLTVGLQFNRKLERSRIIDLALNVPRKCAKRLQLKQIKQKTAHNKNAKAEQKVIDFGEVTKVE